MMRPGLDEVTDLIFCFVDHFEPFRGGASPAEALARVKRWRDHYATAVGDARDADGRTLPHTFFYPAEEYDPDCLDCLAELCHSGAGEVEVHLHHRNDTEENLRRTLVEFTGTLHRRHGLLGTDRAGRLRYGFIHGNWALGNSRPDGDWCGVNNELGVLAETGCYADFTFPSAPSPTQPRIVNAIYRAHDTGRPRAADSGELVSVGEIGIAGLRECGSVSGEAGAQCGRRSPNAELRTGQGGEETGEINHEEHEGGKEGDQELRKAGSIVGRPCTGRREETGESNHKDKGTKGEIGIAGLRECGSVSVGAGAQCGRRSSTDNRSLLIIPGPLALDWSRKKWGVLPRIENGEVSAANPVTPGRVSLWARQGIGVEGHRRWVFVKIHTHGCVDVNSKMLLDSGLRSLTTCLSDLSAKAGWRLHWVTARELFNVVTAAESGLTDDPGRHRDHLVSPRSGVNEMS